MAQDETPGAQGLQATLDLLAHFPDAPLKVTQRGSSIEVTPTDPDTFPVTLYDQGENAMVAAERWHTHYDEPDQAAWCVLWLLTPFYRLVHEHKGGVLVAVWIERYEATGWEPMEPVFFLNPEHEKSWEPESGETYQRRYQQQAVLPSPVPYEQVSRGAVLDENGFPPDFHHGRWVVTDDKPMGMHLF